MRSLVSCMLLLFAFGLAGCEEVASIEADEFMRKAEGLNEVHSAHWTSFLGVIDGKAYLEQGSLVTLTGGPKIETYATNFKDLPLNVQKQITAKQAPWIPKEPYEAKN